MPSEVNDNADALSSAYEHSAASSDSYADSDQFSEPSGLSEPHVAMMAAVSEMPLDFMGAQVELGMGDSDSKWAEQISAAQVSSYQHHHDVHTSTWDRVPMKTQRHVM